MAGAGYAAISRACIMGLGKDSWGREKLAHQRCQKKAATLPGSKYRHPGWEDPSAQDYLCRVKGVIRLLEG